MYARTGFLSRSGASRGGMGSHRSARIAVVAVLAVAVGVGAFPSAVGFPAVHSTASDSLEVSTSGEYGYTPSTFEQVPTGANITVSFTSHSVLPHSFTISSREGYVIPTGDTADQLDQFFATYPAIFSIYENTSGGVATGSFRSPDAPGWYEFVCLVPGHFQMGMYGFIAFGEDLPSNLTTSPSLGVGGAHLSTVDALAVGGVVIAVAVAFVLWQRHRSQPPARTEPSADGSRAAGR